MEPSADDKWLKLSSSDILSGAVQNEEQFKALPEFATISTVLMNARSHEKKSVMSESDYLVGIYGDYDSREFPAASDVQVGSIDPINNYKKGYCIPCSIF